VNAVAYSDVKTYFLSPEEIARLYGAPVKKEEKPKKNPVRIWDKTPKAKPEPKPEPKPAPAPKVVKPKQVRVVKTCKIEDCPVDKRLTRGYCPKHYAKLMRHGDPLAPDHRGRKDGRSDCEICGEIVYSKGLCNKHHQRLKIHGNPHHYKVQIAQRVWVMIDERTGKTLDGSDPLIFKECRICGGNLRRNGYCSTHYARYLKYGNPHYTKKNQGRYRPAILIDVRTGEPVEITVS
jgi:hypothetical protein